MCSSDLEWLYKNYQDENEGFFTQARNNMEMNTHLLEIGKKLKLQKYLIHGGSLVIENSEGIIADLFESLVACIYLQNSYEIVKKFVLKNCTTDFDPYAVTNFVKEINEYYQKTYKKILISILMLKLEKGLCALRLLKKKQLLALEKAN